MLSQYPGDPRIYNPRYADRAATTAVRKGQKKCPLPEREPGPQPTPPPGVRGSGSTGESVGSSFSASIGGKLRRTANGDVDVLHALGGWRGVVESLLPATLFLVVFVVTKQLTYALIASLVTSGVFTVARLVQRSKLVPALSGVVGVAVCAWSAHSTGDANAFYVPGFFVSGGYLLASLISIGLRWPLFGLLFGFIRDEGVRWREKPARLKSYILATWIFVALLGLRLVVQLPLYFAGATEALGVTRLVMGVPLYALTLWVAWRVSAPEENRAVQTHNLIKTDNRESCAARLVPDDTSGAVPSGRGWVVCGEKPNHEKKYSLLCICCCGFSPSGHVLFTAWLVRFSPGCVADGYSWAAGACRKPPVGV